MRVKVKKDLKKKQLMVHVGTPRQQAKVNLCSDAFFVNWVRVQVLQVWLI